MNKVESNLEIEYKFKASHITKEEFHQRIEAQLNHREIPIYVVSCDDYYIREGSDGFLRYRKGGNKTELTLKTKQQGNTVRKEINLNLSDNDDLSIVEFLTLSDYKKHFSVFKEAWIFHLDDCDASFYTLSDGRSFIELEAKNSENVKDAIAVIDKWSILLELNKENRETRSLYEIITNEMLEFKKANI